MDGGCRVARSWGNLRKSCLNRTLAGTWFLAHGLKDADRLSFVRRQRSSASHTWEFARAVLLRSHARAAIFLSIPRDAIMYMRPIIRRVIN